MTPTNREGVEKCSVCGFDYNGVLKLHECPISVKPLFDSITPPSEGVEKIEFEELEAWGIHTDFYFLDVLNGETSLEEARENIKSFRNSKYYTGTKEEYKTIKDSSQ